MSNVETNLIKPFPVAFSGHTLKYEIECICKIFLPMRKFTFLYDTTQLPAGAEEGAVLILEQLGEQSRFWVQVQYRGQVMEQEQQFPVLRKRKNSFANTGSVPCCSGCWKRSLICTLHGDC
mgnify:CR=1 FL=1